MYHYTMGEHDLYSSNICFALLSQDSSSCRWRQFNDSCFNKPLSASNSFNILANSFTDWSGLDSAILRPILSFIESPCPQISKQTTGRLLLINTINAHSYNTALKDPLFAKALMRGDALIPDGASIVKVCKWLKMQSQQRERIAGWDLFVFEMNRLNEKGGRCMFMGSSEKVLALIKQRAAVDYPNLEVVTYSPPYSAHMAMDIQFLPITINPFFLLGSSHANPQQIWICLIDSRHNSCIIFLWKFRLIGAVFDFFAGTTERAPLWWQQHSLEWLYRLIKEPKRMWRRYLVGNVLFLWNICKEKCGYIMGWEVWLTSNGIIYCWFLIIEYGLSKKYYYYWWCRIYW